MAFQNHGHFFERRIPGTFADTVDCHLCLARPIDDTGHRIGRGHAQVIMAMGGQNSLPGGKAIDMLHQILDFLTIFLRQAITRRIRDVHHGGTGLDHGLHHAGQVFIVRASRIFGIELHILHITLGILHGSHGTFNDFLTVRIEFVFNMRVGSTDAGVNTFVFGFAQGIGCHVDVLLHRTGQRTYRGPRHSLGNFYHRIKIARTGDGETCLNHIHAQSFQLLGHLDFLHRVQLTPGNLFTVPQCSVKDK